MKTWKNKCFWLGHKFNTNDTFYHCRRCGKNDCYDEMITTIPDHIFIFCWKIKMKFDRIYWYVINKFKKDDDIPF